MLKLGLTLLIVPCLALMGGYMYEQSLVDDCLDIGGSFDYQNLMCDMQNKQPFIPYMARYPMFVNGGMLLSVLGVFMTVIGLYRPRR